MRKLVIVAVVALSFASCSPMCERGSNRINNLARGKDVMAEPATVVKPKEPEKKPEPAEALKGLRAVPIIGAKDKMGYERRYVFEIGDGVWWKGSGKVPKEGDSIIIKDRTGKPIDRGTLIEFPKEGGVRIKRENGEIVTYEPSGVETSFMPPPRY